MYYVYILRCGDGSRYTGMTNDLARRFRAHACGKGAKYTRSHPPTALDALWRCADETAARRLEYAIKHDLTRPQKDALIDAPQTLGSLFPKLTATDYLSIHALFSDILEGIVP